MFISLTDVQIGNGRCTSPLYELATITDQDWVKRVGFSLSSAGISSDKADSISLKCEKSDNFPAQTVILRLSDYKALILWEGVLFEIERPGSPFTP
jgi:hypothetical protein